MKTDKKKIFFIMEAVDVDKATLALVGADKKIIVKRAIKFSAGKMRLLWRINEFFKENNLKFSDIGGVIAITGPGSFTSIRTSLSIVNTWASVMSIPAVGFSRPEFSNFEDLIKNGIAALKKSKSVKIIHPFYGRPPDITAPKKIKIGLGN